MPRVSKVGDTLATRQKLETDEVVPKGCAHFEVWLGLAEQALLQNEPARAAECRQAASSIAY